MLKLIINADDLGLTPGCNAGIVQAMTQGLISDTTLMINMEHAPAAVELLKTNGINKVGLHLNLTCGRPVLAVSEVPTLVDGEGRFRRKVVQAVQFMSAKEVEQELNAQVEKFLATGLTLTHLDSHHHAHSYPVVLDIAIKLAQRLNVPMRQTSPVVRDKITAAGVLSPEWFTTDFYEQGVNSTNLQNIIAAHDGGVLEIMSHPAQEDPMLFSVSSYNSWRFKELEILTSSQMRAFLQEQGIELISFLEL
ncbi:MAG: YdjC family protein [Firmicutes bacterium]|nr:YdjC family protein [Bacillota bacterium]